MLLTKVQATMRIVARIRTKILRHLLDHDIQREQASLRQCSPQTHLLRNISPTNVQDKYILKCSLLKQHKNSTAFETLNSKYSYI